MNPPRSGSLPERAFANVTRRISIIWRRSISDSEQLYVESVCRGEAVCVSDGQRHRDGRPTEASVVGVGWRLICRCQRISEVPEVCEGRLPTSDDTRECELRETGVPLVWDDRSDDGHRDAPRVVGGLTADPVVADESPRGRRRLLLVPDVLARLPGAPTPHRGRHETHPEGAPAH